MKQPSYFYINLFNVIIKPMNFQYIQTRCLVCGILIFLFGSCDNTSSQKQSAHAQAHDTSGTSSKLTGTWSVASATEYEAGEKERGGKGREFYGPNPKGRLILDENGNYMLTVMRNDIPKFITNDGKPLGREDGTDEMNRKVVHGSIANFGTYEDVDGTLILHIEKATYPNWDAPFEQRRPYKIFGDSLIYIVPNASSGNGKTAEFIWIRMNN